MAVDFGLWSNNVVLVGLNSQRTLAAACNTCYITLMVLHTINGLSTVPQLRSSLNSTLKHAWTLQSLCLSVWSLGSFIHYYILLGRILTWQNTMRSALIYVGSLKSSLQRCWRALSTLLSIQSEYWKIQSE